MVWNAAGTFHTRLSATALTANRKFVFPDQDGTFVVASAGVVEVAVLSTNTIRVSPGVSLVISFSAGATDVGIEIFPGRTTAGATFIDFHTTSATDYDFRIMRFPGTNGQGIIDNIGTGGLQLQINTSPVVFISAGGADVFGALYVSTTLTVSGAAVVLGSLAVGGALSVSGAAVVGSLAVMGTLTVSGTTVVNDITVAGRISASAGNINTLSAGSLFVTANLAVGGNLTVSGTTVVSDLTVAGRISASAGNVANVFSAGEVDASVVSAGTISVISMQLRRGDANAEGGQIDFFRSFDNTSQMAIDIIGSGTATANIRMRILNTNPGLELITIGLDGKLSVLQAGFYSSATASFGTRVFTGDLFVQAGLTVSADTALRGNASILGTLTVSGAAVCTGNLDVHGILSASTFSITNLFVGGTLTVSGASVLYGGTNMRNVSRLEFGVEAVTPYIDFHQSAADAVDFDFRMMVSGSAGIATLQLSNGNGEFAQANSVVGWRANNTPKVWAAFDGVGGVIAQSFNVSAISKVAPGRYTINFKTAISSSACAITYNLDASKLAVNSTTSASYSSGADPAGFIGWGYLSN